MRAQHPQQANVVLGEAIHRVASLEAPAAATIAAAAATAAAAAAAAAHRWLRRRGPAGSGAATTLRCELDLIDEQVSYRKYK